MFERPFHGVRLLALIVLVVAVAILVVYTVSLVIEIASSGWGGARGPILGMFGMTCTAFAMVIVLKTHASRSTERIDDHDSSPSA